MLSICVTSMLSAGRTSQNKTMNLPDQTVAPGKRNGVFDAPSDRDTDRKTDPAIGRDILEEDATATAALVRSSTALKE